MSSRFCELKAGDFSKRMLAAVAAQYGLARNEYEKADGTRESERERPTLRVAKEPGPLPLRRGAATSIRI